MNKTAYILRGASGSGKTTLSQSLTKNSISFVICEADDYFYTEAGEYNFNPLNLGAAHQWCRDKFTQALKNNVETVVCSNTNTTPKEYRFYIDAARQAGYTVHLITVERFMDTQSIHNVPPDVIQKQSERLKKSMQF